MVWFTAIGAGGGVGSKNGFPQNQLQNLEMEGGSVLSRVKNRARRRKTAFPLLCKFLGLGFSKSSGEGFERMLPLDEGLRKDVLPPCTLSSRDIDLLSD